MPIIINQERLRQLENDTGESEIRVQQKCALTPLKCYLQFAKVISTYGQVAAFMKDSFAPFIEPIYTLLFSPGENVPSVNVIIV
jgi:hypothetical protein